MGIANLHSHIPRLNKRTADLAELNRRQPAEARQTSAGVRWLTEGKDRRPNTQLQRKAIQGSMRPSTTIATSMVRLQSGQRAVRYGFELNRDRAFLRIMPTPRASVGLRQSYRKQQAAVENRHRSSHDSQSCQCQDACPPLRCSLSVELLG